MEKRKRALWTLAWVLLLVMGLLVILGGAASLVTAYFAADDPIAGVGLEQFAEMERELPLALRGRRATAASYAITCGILISWMALVPIRRGERWAWFALLTSVGPGSVLSMLRQPILGYRPGAEVGVLMLALLLISLALCYKHMR